METLVKTIKIAVLEDSAFYNKLLTQEIENYSERLTQDYLLGFEVASYLHAEDFLLNLENDIDILFLDYFLENGATCTEIIRQVQEKCPNCEIAVMSSTTTFKTSMVSLSDGASMFIKKDADAFQKACYFIEYVINAQK